MARMKIDLKPNLSAAAKQPLYAGIGATDLAVTAVREYAAELQDRVFAVQKDVTSTVSDVQKQVTGFSPKKVVNDSVEAVEARVAEIQAEAKALPGKVQSTIDENVNTVVATYGDLARRGEAIVRGTKLPTSVEVEVDVDVDVETTDPTPGQKSAKKTTGITRRTEALVKPADTTKTADEKAAGAAKSTSSRSTSKSTSSRTTASKTTAPKTSASKTSSASKTTTAKKAPASKTTASKSTTTKSTPAKKAPASKSTTSSSSTTSTGTSSSTPAKNTSSS